MNNFWYGKSLEEVAKEYLCASLDQCERMQPMSIEGMVELMCGNITIKNNAKDFVADYFDDAIDAIRIYYNPYDTYHLSQYERTANMMISKAAKDLLMSCDTAREYDCTYHIWKRDDLERLKSELCSLSFHSAPFQRAVDLKFESLENYAYRYLDHILKEMEGHTVNLPTLVQEITLPKMSEQDAKNFIKSNFNEAMRLLDEFRTSGYRVDYTNPLEIIQGILYQQQKEILAANPYLIDLIEYDGVKSVKLDADIIEDLQENLKEQQNNVRLAKFGEMKAEKMPNRYPPHQIGRVVNLKKSNNRCEVLY